MTAGRGRGVRPIRGRKLTVADQVLDARLDELDRAYVGAVREAAKSWANGLKGLLGLASTIGLLSAPFSIDHLVRRAQVAVGVLLLLVFIVGAVGLYLAMSSAYGTVELIDRPRTLAELDRAVRSHGDAARLQLRVGVILAMAAVTLLGMAVAVAWLSPPPASSPTAPTAEVSE